MGACATKPKAKVDTAVIPAPEPVDDMVKNTEEVKVVEDEKRVDGVIDEKKDDTENVVVEGAKRPSLDSATPPSLDSAKPPSLDSLLVEKQAEVPSVTKVEEQPPKGTAVMAGAEEVKKNEEKAAKKDERSA